MNCQNCGEPLEHGTLFCESCGARVTKSSPLLPAHTSSRKKKKKRLTRLGILFVMLGSAALIALVFAVVSIIQTASLKSDSPKIEPSGAETTFSTPGGFTSAEAKTAYWQSVYRSYLEQLIPERVNDDSIAPMAMFCFELVDMNDDDIPELVEYVLWTNTENDRYIRVYYIDNGAIRQLGEASLDSERPYTFEPALLHENNTTVPIYITIGKSGSAIYGEEEVCIWRAQSNGTLTFERILFVQYSDDRDTLSSYANPEYVEYDSDLDQYFTYSYRGMYIRRSEYEEYSDFTESIEFQESTSRAIIIVAADNADSPFAQLVASGMTQIDAVNVMVDRLFDLYLNLDEPAN